MPQQPPPAFSPQPQTSNNQRGRGARGRGRGGRDRGGGHRASFSKSGPNNDTRITSIVVEQIPEDKFNDEAIRAFFSEFGPITDINTQPYKRLAVITFSSYDAARAAYESPKVIFDNRFVKVYWFKPDSDQVQRSTQEAINGIKTEDPDMDTNMDVKKEEDEPTISPEEFAAKQAEAQKAHEEKVRKMKEAEDAKSDLDRKIKAQAEERRKMMEKMEAMASRKGKSAQSPAPGANGTEGTPKPTAQEEQKAKSSEALRAQLAALKAEAEAIGLPAEEAEDANPSGYAAFAPYHPRGRGGFNARNRGRGRGGYGATRGVGAWWQGGGVARLDNRPKTVSVRALDGGVDLGDEGVIESLKAFLYVSTFLISG